MGARSPPRWSVTRTVTCWCPAPARVDGADEACAGGVFPQAGCLLFRHPLSAGSKLSGPVAVAGEAATRLGSFYDGSFGPRRHAGVAVVPVRGRVDCAGPGGAAGKQRLDGYLKAQRSGSASFPSGARRPTTAGCSRPPSAASCTDRNGSERRSTGWCRRRGSRTACGRPSTTCWRSRTPARPSIWRMRWDPPGLRSAAVVAPPMRASRRLRTIVDTRGRSRAAGRLTATCSRNPQDLLSAARSGRIWHWSRSSGPTRASNAVSSSRRPRAGLITSGELRGAVFLISGRSSPDAARPRDPRAAAVPEGAGPAGQRVDFAVQRPERAAAHRA